MSRLFRIDFDHFKIAKGHSVFNICNKNLKPYHLRTKVKLIEDPLIFHSHCKLIIHFDEALDLINRDILDLVSSPNEDVKGFNDIFCGMPYFRLICTDSKLIEQLKLLRKNDEFLGLIYFQMFSSNKTEKKRIIAFLTDIF